MVIIVNNFFSLTCTTGIFFFKWGSSGSVGSWTSLHVSMQLPHYKWSPGGLHTLLESSLSSLPLCLFSGAEPEVGWRDWLPQKQLIYPHGAASCAGVRSGAPPSLWCAGGLDGAMRLQADRGSIKHTRRPQRWYLTISSRAAGSGGAPLGIRGFAWLTKEGAPESLL